MKVVNSKPFNQNFTGYVPDPNDAKKFLLKNKKFQTWDTFSFLTAVTSATGFAIGGVGLLSDYLSKEKQQTALKNSASVLDSFKSFETAGTQGAIPNTKEDKKDGKKEGAKTITPSTKFSKTGMTFAKIGIAFSGIAGIFNGISMGLPLMAAGEALNLCSSPIIETPIGTGLFGIALAAVFSGRALENDPELKLDNAKLAKKEGLKNKAAYIMENIKGCATAVWESGNTIRTNLVDLAKKDKRKEAMSFFRDNVFSIKPKKLVLQEFIDEKGVVTIARGFKNNPYLMHGASLLLAAGGTILALSSMIKSSTGQKVGLKTYEVGGSLDNLSLSRWGMEKASTAAVGSPGAKLAGYLLGASGLTILAGQPGVDEKWGRGIQWVGTALLFSVFAVERFPKAFKKLVSQPEFKTLVRQWEVDLTKVYSNKELKPKLGEIVKAIANGTEIKDPLVKQIIETAEGVLKKSVQNEMKIKKMAKKGIKIEPVSLYRSTETAEEISNKIMATKMKTGFKAKKGVNIPTEKIYRKTATTEEIFKEIVAALEAKPELKGKVNGAVSHFGNDGKATELMKSLKEQAKATFQAA